MSSCRAMYLIRYLACHRYGQEKSRVCGNSMGRMGGLVLYSANKHSMLLSSSSTTCDRLRSSSILCCTTSLTYFCSDFHYRH